MTRFHIVAGLTVISGTALVCFHDFTALAGLIFLFIIVGGFGVAVPQMKYFGPFICRGTGKGKQVALTFDDGPDPRSTPRLLEILREAKIPAAFFCIGKHVAAHPELAAQIVREGHLLENHTYNHSYFTNFFSTTRLCREMTETREAIERASGTATAYYRPPMGQSNPRVFRAARKMQMQVVGWTIRSLDTIIRDPKRIVARIRCRLHDGAIILLHDGHIPVEKLEDTVKSLLDTLKQNGYEVVRLDELLK